MTPTAAMTNEQLGAFMRLLFCVRGPHTRNWRPRQA